MMEATVVIRCDMASKTERGKCKSYTAVLLDNSQLNTPFPSGVQSTIKLELEKKGWWFRSQHAVSCPACSTDRPKDKALSGAECECGYGTGCGLC